MKNHLIAGNLPRLAHVQYMCNSYSITQCIYTLQAEALLQRMMAVDGDKSAAQDMATRQKIASFPPEIYDPDLLTKIKGLP